MAMLNNQMVTFYSHQYEFGLSSSCQSNFFGWWSVRGLYYLGNIIIDVLRSPFSTSVMESVPGFWTLNQTWYSGWLQNPNHQLKTVVFTSHDFGWLSTIGEAIHAEGNHQPPSSGNEKTWLENWWKRGIFIDDAPGEKLTYSNIHLDPMATFDETGGYVCMIMCIYIYIHEFANWNAHPSIPLCVVNSLSSWYNPHFGCVKSIILPGRIVTLWLIMAHL